MKLNISFESLLLAAICLADMIATIVFVSLGHACESNPLMAACLNHSLGLFVAVKIASFIPFIIVCEIHKRRNPAFVRMAMRAAIGLYLAAYVILVTQQNIAC